jgi:hypothetical protein
MKLHRQRVGTRLGNRIGIRMPAAGPAKLTSNFDQGHEQYRTDVRLISDYKMTVPHRAKFHTLLNKTKGKEEYQNADREVQGCT